MSKTDLLDLLNWQNQTIGGRRLLFILCVGLAISAIIFVTYRLTYNGVSYNAKFNVSNSVILLITIVIMIMISSNIIISLGMVGALSIVRFRTAIKDPRDTVFIFWSIAEGLSIGSQNFKLAIISTIFIAIVIVAASYIARFTAKYLIIVRADDAVDKEKIQEALKKYNLFVKLRASNNTPGNCEMIFEVLAKKELNLKAVDEIKAMDGIVSVNMLLESGETVG
jgi:uncharacterized membrane protein YhiD involved in acid resistance